MDGLEEQRTLSDLESAFRRLVKNHLASLLESRRIYWKQRNTVRWVKLGMKILTFLLYGHHQSQKEFHSLSCLA
jgi:hypothetical protein